MVQAIDEYLGSAWTIWMDWTKELSRCRDANRQRDPDTTVTFEPS